MFEQMRSGLIEELAEKQLSIIIPCYNTEKYISECIESVCNQNIKNIEIICVDDGSTDRTAEIVKEWEEKDSRIILIHQENKGPSAARNTGLRVSRGKYIYFLDSDDKIIDASALEDACRKMDEQQLEVLVGAAKTFYDEEALRERFPQYENRYRITHEYQGVFSGPELIDALRKNGEWTVTPATRIFQREFLLKNKLFYIEGQLHEDVYYSLASLFLAKRTGVTCQILYGRRIRESSIMTQKITYKNVLGYLSNMIEGLRFLEAHRDIREFDTRTGYTVIGAKKDTVRTYLLLDEKEKKLFRNVLTAEQNYYFRTFIEDEASYKKAYMQLTETPAEASVVEYYKNVTPDVVIAFVCDQSFLEPAMIAIQSIIDYKEKNDNYRIYIICNDLSADAKRKFSVLREETVDICCIEADTGKYETFLNKEKRKMNNVSMLEVLKFDLPDLLQEKKVLYLDADTLIRGDLRSIYETNIDNYYLAAVADSRLMGVEKTQYTQTEQYFNTGVMLLNLKLLRTDHVTEKLIETKKKGKDIDLTDHDVFNLVMAGYVKLLPIRYNYMCADLMRNASKWNFDQLNEKYGTAYNNLSEMSEDALVVHFASKGKPWEDSEVLFYREWYEMFERVYKKLAGISEKNSFFQRVLFNETCVWRERCRVEEKEKDLKNEQIKKLKIVLEEQKTALEEQKTALEEQKTALEEQKTALKELKTALKKQRTLLKNIKKSRSYRVGQWIAKPWRWIKKQIRWKHTA